jgi:hypothetical protein
VKSEQKKVIGMMIVGAKELKIFPKLHQGSSRTGTIPPTKVYSLPGHHKDKNSGIQLVKKWKVRPTAMTLGCMPNLKAFHDKTT